MTRVRMVSIVAVAATVAAVLAAAPTAAAPKPNCMRGGAKLVAADGPVRVVRLVRRPGAQRTRVHSIVACWVTTGRRATIVREEDFGDDLRTTTQVEIVDKRWVGVIVRYEGGVSESVEAIVYDARARRRVHDSDACADSRGDRSGVDDAVFLPRGGLAFSCSRLFVFRDARSAEPEELEPAGTDVRNLAVARNHRDFFDRLYWTVASGGTETARSLGLGS